MQLWAPGWATAKKIFFLLFTYQTNPAPVRPDPIDEFYLRLGVKGHASGALSNFAVFKKCMHPDHPPESWQARAQRLALHQVMRDVFTGEVIDALHANGPEAANRFFTTLLAAPVTPMKMHEPIRDLLAASVDPAYLLSPAAAGLKTHIIEACRLLPRLGFVKPGTLERWRLNWALIENAPKARRTMATRRENCGGFPEALRLG